MLHASRKKKKNKITSRSSLLHYKETSINSCREKNGLLWGLVEILVSAHVSISNIARLKGSFLIGPYESGRISKEIINDVKVFLFENNTSVRGSHAL